MSTQPTPEELDALVYTQCPDFDMWHEGPSIDDVRAIIREAISRWGAPATGGDPVGWEWRWKDTSPHTVTSGQWSEWKRVEARSRLSTVEDAVREFQHYIADGAAYELRQLYTSPQPVREPLDAAALAQRAKVGAIQTDHNDNVVLRRAEYRSQMEGRFERGWREAEKYHGITGGRT